MSVELLQPLDCDIAPPQQFPSPFNNQPHELAGFAAKHLQKRLTTLTAATHDFNASRGGKMLGVLVVATPDNRLGYLSAFSGMLGGHWNVAGFAPVVFDQDRHAILLQEGQQQLNAIDQAQQQILRSPEYTNAVKQQQSVQQEADQRIADNRQLNTNNKKQRSELRKAHASDAELLKVLDQQSREDKRTRQQLQHEVKRKVAEADAPVVRFTSELRELKNRRRKVSANLQRKLFDEYTIHSVASRSVKLRSLFTDKLPPGGAGDCAAVKLINAAITERLTPLCLGEFWWGAAVGLRQHGRFYPACRGKCRPILPHMLQGLSVEAPRYEQPPVFAPDLPSVVYEDDAIVVVNKPSGMLSVPGHAITDSVEARLRKHYPVTSNQTLLLHRLDQPTSGLMVAAKSAPVHKHLHLQFQQRKVQKRYIARLAATGLPASGEIHLPLRVDIDDRPRQLVCHQHGKPAHTVYRVLSKEANTTLVEFQPVTGRTHQLRVHAAHPHGLNAAIVGDELYGQPADRLHLHAQALSFTHPVTEKPMSFTVPAPFAENQKRQPGGLT